jgi:hypothetical protein
MRSIRNLVILCVLLTTAVVLNVITTTLGDGTSNLTVFNKTAAYLHVFIEGAAYPYVAPGHSVTHSTSARETFYVEAFYSPGQGKTGDIIDSTFTLPYSPPVTYSTGDECSCQDPNSSYYCSDDEGAVTTPAQGGSASWEITEDLFQE